MMVGPQACLQISWNKLPSFFFLVSRSRVALSPLDIFFDDHLCSNIWDGIAGAAAALHGQVRKRWLWLYPVWLPSSVLEKPRRRRPSQGACVVSYCLLIMQLAGARVGDFIIGLNGYRVDNLGHKSFVKLVKSIPKKDLHFVAQHRPDVCTLPLHY